jgi:hypothetical protein
VPGRRETVVTRFAMAAATLVVLHFVAGAAAVFGE